ncbi:NUDIX hydrolase [Salinarimonas rosea]|uniref:NUDIX hydrolase n=1 Tax=Salinarimonas rosea TaxID=552063 RepID=UPI000407048D|nr:NUDIX domain-containing protein [Salinarimonas rosea]
MYLPEGYAPLFVDGTPEPIGAVTGPVAGVLSGLAAARPDGFALPAGDLQRALDAAVERLLAAGLCPPPRGEAIGVLAGRDGAELARVDRAAAEPLGLLVRKVCLVGHVDGTPRRVWLARRATGQRTAPGLLDTTVAGGVPAGATPDETLREEAREEASLTPERLREARPAARLDRLSPGPDGLSREDLLVWDLAMTPDERPAPRDDEIAGFEPWLLPDLARALVVARDFKPGAAIVLRDALARWGAASGG